MRRIDLQETREGKVSELALDKVKDKQWWFKKPAPGPADLEAASTSKDEPKFEPKFDPKGDQNVRSLLATITNLHVDDFEPIGSPMTIDEKKALLRIELDYDSSEFDEKSKVRRENGSAADW